MSRRILTVVLTDIDGFAERAREIPRDTLLQLLEKHEELLLPLVEQYGGTVLKTLGESFLLVFESPTDAVVAATLMQARLRGFNEGLEDQQQIRLRVAIDSGEVDVVGGDVPVDVFGDPVHIASLLSEVNEPGEVYFTEATFLAMNREDVPTSVVDRFKLRGVSHPIQVYRVVQDPGLEDFKRLVEQLPPRPRPVATRGIFSRSLLLGLEERRRVDAPQRLGPWIVAAAALPIAFVLLWMGAKQLQFRADLHRVATHIERSETESAIGLASALHEKRPTNRRATEMLDEALSADIEHLLDQQRRGDALRRARIYNERFPFIEGVEALERDVMLEIAIQQPMSLGVQRLDELLSRFPTDHDARIQYARAAIERDDVSVSVRRAMYEAVVVAKDRREVVDEIWFRQLADRYIREIWRPDPALDGLIELIGPDLQTIAWDMVYDPRKEAVIGRLNSYYILKNTGAELDEFRFHLVHFLTGQANLTYKDDTERYLRRMLTTHTPEELNERIDFALPHPDILEMGTYNSKLITDVLVAIAPSVRTDLLDGVRHKDKNFRSRAVAILEEVGWLTPALRAEYHFTSLRYPDEVQAYGVLEALAELEAINPADIETEDAITLLTEVALWAEIKRGNRGPHDSDVLVTALEGIMTKANRLTKALEAES